MNGPPILLTIVLIISVGLITTILMAIENHLEGHKWDIIKLLSPLIVTIVIALAIYILPHLLNLLQIP